MNDMVNNNDGDDVDYDDIDLFNGFKRIKKNSKYRKW